MQPPEPAQADDADFDGGEGLLADGFGSLSNRLATYLTKKSVIIASAMNDTHDLNSLFDRSIDDEVVFNR